MKLSSNIVLFFLTIRGLKMYNMDDDDDDDDIMNVKIILIRMKTFCYLRHYLIKVEISFEIALIFPSITLVNK